MDPSVSCDVDGGRPETSVASRARELVVSRDVADVKEGVCSSTCSSEQQWSVVE